MMTTSRLAKATDGAAPNSPENRFGFSISPTNAKPVTNSPPLTALAARMATSFIGVRHLFPGPRRVMRARSGPPDGSAGGRQRAGPDRRLATVVHAVLARLLRRVERHVGRSQEAL